MKIFLQEKLKHERLKHENFITRKFPDLRYVSSPRCSGQSHGQDGCSMLPCMPQVLEGFYHSGNRFQGIERSFAI